MPGNAKSEYLSELASVSARGTAGQLVEFLAERAKAGVADFKTDFGYRLLSCGQQALGQVEPTTRDQLMRRLPEGSSKETMEMKRRKTGFAGSPLERQSILVLGREKITCPAQPAKRFIVDKTGG